MCFLFLGIWCETWGTDIKLHRGCLDAGSEAYGVKVCGAFRFVRCWCAEPLGILDVTSETKGELAVKV
jgi:hypothetical protein